MDQRPAPWPAFFRRRSSASIWHRLGDCKLRYCLIKRKWARARAAERSKKASILAGSFQQREQFAMHRVVSDDDIALGEHRVAAIDVGDEAAGLTDHQQA